MTFLLVLLGAATLVWQPNLEPDVALYAVYSRPVGSSAQYVIIGTTPGLSLPVPTPTVKQEYVVTVTDFAGNESDFSPPGTAKPFPPLNPRIERGAP